MNNIKFNQRNFLKLFKQDTDESYKAYLKAQKNYLSVLKKFIKQEIATKNDYQERYERSAVCFPDYQWDFEGLDSQIKVLFGMIGDYEFELLNPEEFEKA